jgi:hypothetical protein
MDAGVIDLAADSSTMVRTLVPIGTSTRPAWRTFR